MKNRRQIGEIAASLGLIVLALGAVLGTFLAFREIIKPHPAGIPGTCATPVWARTGGASDGCPSYTARGE